MFLANASSGILSQSPQTGEDAVIGLWLKGGGFLVGTCESFFFVRIESRIESDVRFVFESNIRIESAVYLIHRYFVFVTNESDVQTTELSTCLFQFSHKARQTMLL